jgi:hypothetical protein
MDREASPNCQPNRCNLNFVNRFWGFALSYDSDDPRSDLNRESVKWVQLTKDVPGEKRTFHVLVPVGPPAPGLVQRQEAFKALTAQMSRDNILVTASDL